MSFRSVALGATIAALLLGSRIAAAVEPGKTSLEARTEAAAHALRHEPRLSALSDAQRRSLTQFVTGNLLFVVLHELGHTLISEMGLPVLGREEDAADAFASVALIIMQDEFSTRVLAEAARGWFLSDRRERAENTPLAYYDEHSLSRQRAYHIVCLMVGSDREKFRELAEATGMPPERQASCQGDYSNASWSWDTVLKPHRRNGGPKATIPVRYLDGGEKFSTIERAMRFIGLMETVAERSSDMFAWRAPFAMEAKACGIAHAEWSLASRTLTLCYELVQELADLHARYGAQPLVSQVSP